MCVVSLGFSFLARWVYRAGLDLIGCGRNSVIALGVGSWFSWVSWYVSIFASVDLFRALRWDCLETFSIRTAVLGSLTG